MEKRRSPCDGPEINKVCEPVATLSEQSTSYDFDARVSILKSLGTEPRTNVRCIDAEFEPCTSPQLVRDCGLEDLDDEILESSQRLIDAIAPEDHAAVMAALTRARSLGASFTEITPTDAHLARDDGRMNLHMVNMYSEWGVMVCVTGGSLKPIGDDDDRNRRPATPRRIVQRRDQSSHTLWVDEGTELLLGWTPEQVIGESALHFVHPDDHDRAIEGWIAMLGGGGGEPARLRYLKADETYLWVEVSQSNHLDDPERGYVEIELIDVDAEMTALAKARSGEEQFAVLTESLPVGIIQLGCDAEIVYMNQWLRDLFPMDVIDPTEPGLVFHADSDAVRTAFTSVIASGVSTNLDARLVEGKTGDVHRCRIRIRSLGTNDEGESRGAIASVEDLTETLDLQRELQRRATTDFLTGLPNRAALMDWLDEGLRDPMSGDLSGVTVLFLDLDGFKRVNDGLGHDAGDMLLKVVAERASHVIRPTDILARIGGDEFVVACQGEMTDEACFALADRIVASFDDPVVLNATTATVGCSIGIARSNGRDPEETLGNADMAMYEAKRAGGGRWALYEDGLRDRLATQFHIENEIRRGIAEGHFRLHLQPVVDLASGLTVATEALVRWQHPEQGLLAPGLFLPAAERSGLVIQLGAWIVDEACRLATRMVDALERPCRMAINLSARQIVDDGFHEQLIAIVERHGIDPNMLILEVTETTLIDTSDETMFALADLADLGMTVALDDFGTGYSSLNHLRLMPANMVKIDGSYTADLGIDPGTTAIAEAMVGLSRSLGQELIVEGIEEPHQLWRLQQMGVHLGQGYLLARPMPEEDFFAFDRTVTPVDAIVRAEAR